MTPNEDLAGFSTAPSADALLVVLVTVPSDGTGEKLTEKLLSEKLIACANIISGVRSIYRWEGKVERSTEELLIIKSTSSVFAKLQQAIETHHPYEVPEIVALPAARVNESYLTWVLGETAASR